MEHWHAAALEALNTLNNIRHTRPISDAGLGFVEHWHAAALEALNTPRT